MTISTIYVATLLDCGSVPGCGGPVTGMRKTVWWPRSGAGRGGAPPRPSHTGHIWAAANHDICSLLNIILYQIRLLNTALDENSLPSLQLQPHRRWWLFLNIHQHHVQTYIKHQHQEVFKISGKTCDEKFQITNVYLLRSSAMKRHYVSEQKL